MLGFEVEHDIPLGQHRWLTVVEKDNPNGTELPLKPSEHKPSSKEAPVRDGIPAASFQVDDPEAEFDRPQGLGVEFTQAPMDAGTLRKAVLNDTCGNLILLVEMTEVG